jgi:uncharacterized protein (TIRG00374 family)
MAAGLVYTLLRGGLPLVPRGGDFAGVRWWTVGAYALSLFVTVWFRAVRWRFLLRPFAEVTRRRVLAVSLIGAAAQVVLPFRIGELVRPYLIRDGERVTMANALGTIVAERLVDALCVATIDGSALTLVPTIDPLPTYAVGMKVPLAGVRAYAWTFLTVSVCGLTAVAVFYFARGFAARLTKAVFRPFSERLGTTLATTLERFADGLSFLSRGHAAAGFLTETALYWISNGLGMWLLAWGCGIRHEGGAPLSVGEAFALLGMLGLAVALPGPPGMLGLFQAGVFVGMSMYFGEPTVTGPGAAFVFLLYLVQIVFTLGSAAIALAVTPGAAAAMGEAATAEAA